MGEFTIQTQRIPTMYFFGVTTGKSSSRRMFPLWMDILGIEALLVGLDLMAGRGASRVGLGSGGGH